MENLGRATRSNPELNKLVGNLKLLPINANVLLIMSHNAGQHDLTVEAIQSEFDDINARNGDVIEIGGKRFLYSDGEKKRRN